MTNTLICSMCRNRVSRGQNIIGISSEPLHRTLSEATHHKQVLDPGLPHPPPQVSRRYLLHSFSHEIRTRVFRCLDLPLLPHQRYKPLHGLCIRLLVLRTAFSLSILASILSILMAPGRPLSFLTLL